MISFILLQENIINDDKKREIAWESLPTHKKIIINGANFIVPIGAGMAFAGSGLSKPINIGNGLGYAPGTLGVTLTTSYIGRALTNKYLDYVYNQDKKKK